MHGIAAIDGEILPVDEARIPVLDRGFLYGDSVYEVVRTYGGRPFALHEHLERLLRSAAVLGLDLPLTLDEFKREVERVLEAAGEGEWYVRVVITRGGGPIGLDPALADQPRRVLLVLPLPDFPDELWTQGVGVALVETGRGGDCRMAAGAKTGNYLTNIMALRQARSRGAYEAVMVDAEGRIGEATTSNVFLVADGEVLTPPLAAGILDGITRRKVVELCAAAGLTLRQTHLTPEDLRGADEVFLTATLKQVLPVTTVDGAPVGEGRPGPVTQELSRLFQEQTTRR